MLGVLIPAPVALPGYGLHLKVRLKRVKLQFDMLTSQVLLGTLSIDATLQQRLLSIKRRRKFSSLAVPQALSRY